MTYYTSSTIPTADWTYNTDSKSVIQPKVTRRWPDQDQIGNIAKVVSEPNGRTPIASVKQNTNPTSALAVQNIGPLIPSNGFVQDDLIPDQATCDQKATLVLQRMTMLTEVIDVGLMDNPFFQSHDHILLNITDASGNAVVSSPALAPFHVDQWTEDLNQRSMTLTCSRSVMV